MEVLTSMGPPGIARLASPGFSLSIEVCASLRYFVTMLFAVTSLMSNIIGPSLLIVPFIPGGPFMG